MGDLQSVGGAATGAILQVLTQREQAKQKAFENQLAQQKHDLELQRMQQEMAQSAAELDYKKQDMQMKAEDRRAVLQEKRQTAAEKDVADRFIGGDIPATPEDAALVHTANRAQYANPAPVAVMGGPGGSPVRIGLPAMANGQAPGAVPGITPVMGGQLQVAPTAQERRAKAFDASLDPADPNSALIRLASGYADAHGGRPLPAGVVAKPVAEKPDQEQFMMTRDGKLVPMGVTPAGSAVHLQPAPINVNAGPQGQLYNDFDPATGQQRLFRVQGTTATPVSLPGGPGPKTDPVPTAVKTRMDFATRVASHIPDIKAEIAQADAQGLLGPTMGRWNEFLAGKVGATGDPAKDALLAKLRTDVSFLKSGMGVVHSGARGGAVQIVQRFDSLLSSDRMTKEMLNGAIDGFKGWLDTYAKDPKAFGEVAPVTGESAADKAKKFWGGGD